MNTYRVTVGGDVLYETDDREAAATVAVEEAAIQRGFGLTPNADPLDVDIIGPDGRSVFYEVMR